MDPLFHYMKFGWKENRRPNRWFSPSLVERTAMLGNPETPPFVLLLAALDESAVRKFREMTEKRLYLDFGHTDCWDCAVMRGHFDSTYYRARYPDVPENRDALEHFCEIGWRELRNPNPDFDTHYYASMNTDVGEAAINAFVHYLSDGKQEGRKPRPVRPTDQKILKQLVSVEELAAKAGRNVTGLRFEDANLLVLKALAQATGKRSVVFSVSHDRYNAHTGGVQKFIRDEEGHAVAEGHVYIHLCPAFPMQCLAPVAAAASFLVNVTLNGEFLGTFTLAEISDVLLALRKKKLKTAHVILHSLMGWHLPSLADFVTQAEASNHFYTHDYFALCPEYRLLRNGIAACHAPALGAADCGVCLHGIARVQADAAMAAFFGIVKPEMIYPSASARAVFEETRYAALPGRIVPHLTVGKRLEPLKQTVETSPPAGEARPRLRVAFCGAAVAHKGFPLFEEVVERCRADAHLEFFHFGMDKSDLPGVTFVAAQLEKGRSIMPARLREQGIDIVFVPSTWRETFNFIAYEAVEGGAALIALEGAGNVQDFVAQNGVGAIVSGWQDAVTLLRSPSLPDDVARWKQAGAALRFTPTRSIFTGEVA
ncbi:hypothetical protein [Oceanibaculum nanhaiense]|uniref:hypothetical protein n=1 Tax=Oceanibaculum nanhaiense TaxID=1909734 RepID=UPI003D2889CF